MKISDYIEKPTPIGTDLIEIEESPGGHSRKVQISNLTQAAGDKTFVQAFTSQSVVTVNHNLGKRPAVTAIDSANDECMGDVVHTSVNSCIVTFSAPFSGTIFCN